MPENEVANNAALRQFEIREGDQVARLTYSMRDSGALDLIHTEVPKALEGQPRFVRNNRMGKYRALE